MEGEQGICLLAHIPGEKIREKIGKDAEIFFLVFDEKDNIVELKRREVEQSALKGKKALYYSLLPLPPGTYKTSIVMRDMQTGESAVDRAQIEIPKISRPIPVAAPRRPTRFNSSRGWRPPSTLQTAGGSPSAATARAAKVSGSRRSVIRRAR